MPTNSNPTIVWRRILADVWRLSDWARKTGTDEQRQAVTTVIGTLNALASHFDLTLMPNSLAASINKPIASSDDDEGDQSEAYGFAAYHRGEDYDNCPADIQTPDLWRKGYHEAWKKANPTE